MYSPLLEKAFRMALEGHASQKRKGEETPYITHPVGVALILARHGFSEEVIAAGLTHDLVEDTPYTEDDLRNELGNRVTDIVMSVTNSATLPWREKKEVYIQSVKEGGVEAKAVSVADKIHNAESLIARYRDVGPRLWSDFNASREDKLWFEREMLSMLTETWSHPLIDEYESLVNEMSALA
jgi:(p)ppGpp synthase/HD superfamily hydrolase